MTDFDDEDPDTESIEEAIEVAPTEQEILLQVLALPRATIDDYCRASAEYVRQANQLSASQMKATQIGLSSVLAKVTLEDLRDVLHGGLEQAVAGERKVGGGLREVKADVSEVTEMDGLTLAVELKPVHLAVGRAIWNRFGDIRTFAVNIHLKFPFAVVGGVMTLPTQERQASGSDDWKATTHLVERAVARFIRAGGRETEGGLRTFWRASEWSCSTTRMVRSSPIFPRMGRGCGGLSSSSRSRWRTTPVLEWSDGTPGRSVCPGAGTMWRVF